MTSFYWPYYIFGLIALIVTNYLFTVIPLKLQQAIDLFYELGSIHEVKKITGIPDPTLHGWIRPEVKYERLSIKELNEKYEYHMNQADMIDKIKTEKESKRNQNLEKISELEDFLKTTMDAGMEELAKLKQEIE